jgi:hypothetical protein
MSQIFKNNIKVYIHRIMDYKEEYNKLTNRYRIVSNYLIRQIKILAELIL